LVDRDGARVGLRLLELSTPEPSSALDYEELREERRAADEEEEDRVLYVACTRAENRLLLSGSASFERWPPSRPGVAPIAWLAPALVSDVPSLVASDQRPTDALTVDMGGGLRVRCVFNAPDDRTQGGVDPAGESSNAPAGGAGSGLTRLGNVSVADSGATLATPRVQVPLMDNSATMSYTSLAELERCGYRYYLERVLGLPENRAVARSGDDGGIEARTRGTIVHVLLESIDFARPQLPSVQEVGIVARRIGASVGAGEHELIAALIARALASDPARRLATTRRPRREHPFAFSLDPGEPLITGVLDLIVEQSDGSSLIVDYKSDRLVGSKDLERLVQRDYSIQRLLYALAALEDGVEQVEVAHWFLERPDTWVATRFTSGERHHLRRLLLSRVENARTSGLTVTEHPHRGICFTCPGRGGLCSWGEDRTMAEDPHGGNPHHQ
jgi:hypothetical protein